MGTPHPQAYNPPMAALAELISVDSITLSGLPMPLTIRLPVKLSDHALIEFSRSIRPYQVERNANGELEIMSPNGVKSGSREAYAMRILGNWADEHGGAVISSQGGFTLADGSVRMADASWITDERWKVLNEQEHDGFASMSPNFLIEIRSQTDSRPKLQAKMEMWIANGAQLAWMIDPYAATLTIYRPDTAPETLERPDWVEATTVVPGFRLETSRLWAR
jgi:Uma2 family endonuclease